MDKIFVVRHRGMIAVSVDEVRAALESAAIAAREIEDIELDTRQFAGEDDAVSWDAAHGYVWQESQELREKLARTPGAVVAYFGGHPEVPLVVALGAYLGEEHDVTPFDRHRQDSWTWPDTQTTLHVEVVGVPSDTQAIAGPAVVRVEISASVGDSFVHEHVSETEKTADVRIRPRDNDPRVASHVRSLGDVAAVREAARLALAALIERRPNVTAVHLFVAAPPSICVVVGQELRLRNMPAAETYRHRRTAGGEAVVTSAIRISLGGPQPSAVPLTDEENNRAWDLRRNVWEPALRDVEAYAANKRRDAPSSELWYSRLEPRDALARIRPFPALPPVYRVVPPSSTVVAESMEGAYYGYEREHARWRVNDRFLLQLNAAFGSNDEKTRQLVRMFMFHEALHVAHGITKAKVEEVGKFAYGLEHVDYTADLYAILHELDRGLAVDTRPLQDFGSLKTTIADLIDLVLRSFWAFEDTAPLRRMEFRRIRRYLMWYWQEIRVRHTSTPPQLAAVLARKPIVELVGLAPSVESRRYYGSLRQFDERVGLELGIILDDEELKRVYSSVPVPIPELVRALRDHDHDQVRQFFRRVFDEIGDARALPAAAHATDLGSTL